MGLMKVAVVVAVASATLGFGSVGATAGTADPCPATAHYENAQHNGATCAALSSTPTQRWSVTLLGRASYPVIGDGLVFVTTTNKGSASGGWLYALRQSDGSIAWGPRPLTGAYFPLALDGRRVFVNNYAGTVVAYNAQTGRQLWAAATDSSSGEPVAWKGAVYVHGSGQVYALSETDGHRLWTSTSLDGNGSAPAVDRTGVYVNGGCSRFRLSRSTGAVLWSGNDGCTGGGGGVSYLSNGRFFDTTKDHITLESTGSAVGSFSGRPAFSGTTGFFANRASLFAENVKKLTPLFTNALPGNVTAGPVVANGLVYVGTSNGHVYALDPATGDVVITLDLPGAPGGGGQYRSAPSDLNIGDNLLVVPTGSTVTAFG